MTTKVSPLPPLPLLIESEMPPSLLPFLQYTVVVAVALLMRERGSTRFPKEEEGKSGGSNRIPFFLDFFCEYIGVGLPTYFPPHLKLNRPR